MTIFGKFLLVINLAFSLLGLTWAVFVFASPTESPEKLEDYKKKADSERKSVRAALTVRDKAAEALRAAETGIDNPKEVPDSIAPGKLRHLERDWYDAKLTHLRVGDPEGTPPEKKSIGLLAIQFDDKTGNTVMDVKNGDSPEAIARARPKLGPLKDTKEKDKPIEQPLVVLDKIRQDALQAIVGMGQKADTLMSTIQKHIELTEKLLGDPEKKLKGLQQQVIDERTKSDKLLKQLEDLRPLYVNSAVESELILRRLQAERERYKELQKQPAGEK